MKQKKQLKEVPANAVYRGCESAGRFLWREYYSSAKLSADEYENGVADIVVLHKRDTKNPAVDDEVEHIFQYTNGGILTGREGV